MSKKATPKPKTKGELIKTFTDDIFLLISFMEQKNPKDDLVKSLRGKVNLARRVYDAAIIEHAGGYFNKYQDQIIARDEQFFLKNDICAMEKIEDKFIIEIINTIRGMYVGLTAGEKDYLYDKVQVLLATYFEYILL